MVKYRAVELHLNAASADCRPEGTTPLIQMWKALPAWTQFRIGIEHSDSFKRPVLRCRSEVAALIKVIADNGGQLHIQPQNAQNSTKLP